VPANGLVSGVSKIVGIAGFFLQPAANHPKTPASKACWCAEYVSQLVHEATKKSLRRNDSSRLRAGDDQQHFHDRRLAAAGGGPELPPVQRS
jgi:hypothetical protein